MADARPSPLAGSFRLFQVAGISVHLHWSWFLIAILAYPNRGESYTSPVWNVIEYLTLFGIVLLHEFGHALACRQVGGRANEILLWPLGGIAFVSPPPRPGAWLWSIAAGPLVNLVLVPLTVGAYIAASTQGLADTHPDAHHYLFAVMVMNAFLLVFNLLPIYPLDGGQILQALLWFFIGRAQSLMVVSVIGLVAVVGVVAVAVLLQDIWIGVLAVFVAIRSWAGFQQAKLLAQLDRLPRHADAACPSCKAHPFAGNLWECHQCGAGFDMFAHGAICPSCSERFPETPCPECGQAFPIQQWLADRNDSAPETDYR